jgi:tetratricopeptide (TPR) repeat protein
MLDEDLEQRAYEFVRDMWPLARPYIFYSLKPHVHEDIPFRWFQLMIECDEPSAVERILEELVIHGADSNYLEDLGALAQLLEQTLDPEAEDKILQVLNSKDAPKAAIGILERLIKNTKPTFPRDTPADSPWVNLERVYAANRKYLDAARLFDAGKKEEAARTIEELLKAEPQYPLALMLKRMLR